MKYKSNKGFSHGQADKIGVLVTNLGTPQAPTKQALRPYLKEFLSDPRVVEVPKAIWWFVLNGIILNLLGLTIIYLFLTIPLLGMNLKLIAPRMGSV